MSGRGIRGWATLFSYANKESYVIFPNEVITMMLPKATEHLLYGGSLAFPTCVWLWPTLKNNKSIDYHLVYLHVWVHTCVQAHVYPEWKFGETILTLCMFNVL